MRLLLHLNLCFLRLLLLLLSHGTIWLPRARVLCCVTQHLERI
jgi:hypothetical protein